MRVGRLSYLIVVAFLLAVSWMAYWIGYISSKPASFEKFSHLEQQPPDRAAKYFANNLRNVSSINSHVIVNAAKEENIVKNKVLNEVDELFAQRIHKSHVAHISAHLQAANFENKTKSKLLQKKQPLKEIKKTENKKEMAAVLFDADDPYYALIHVGNANKVHAKIHEKLASIPDSVSKQSYIFETDKLPENPRLRPSVANGHLGTVVHGASVFMDGLYNGYMNQSHRAAIPSTCSFNITGTEPATDFSRVYRLNTVEGIYSEITRGKTYNLTQRIYAHRSLPHLLVVEVDLERSKSTDVEKLIVKLNKWTASYDITFTKKDSDMEGVSYKVGRINSPETHDLPHSEVHVLYDQVPDTLVPPQSSGRVKWVFLTAIANSKEKVFSAYQEGQALVQNNDDLYARHVAAWVSVWQQGRIDVVGNTKLARAVYGSLYYILSSMPVSVDDDGLDFVGLSPTGLPYGDEEDDYMGHVFWDQETWMFPPVLMFRPDLARRLLFTRKRTMAAAAENSKRNTHKGLQYPWESARSGVDVTPDLNCSKFEQHISGDISLSIRQYLYATGDTRLLTVDGFDEIVTGIANFWVSRLKYNSQTELYEIHGVMPPDEHAIFVNNSVYTNVIAQLSLAAPQYIFSLLNKSETHWKPMADAMYIPFDSSHQYHPEYDGYKFGQKVKQADTILLGYPVEYSMPQSVRLNDLEIYEKVTNKSGPAMSWSMFCIGWLEVNKTDRAAENLKKNFNYIQNEFHVWSENTLGVDKGATNFITGMGGFLQSIMFGYGGLRLHKDRLDLDPVLPPATSELHFTGLSYLGNKFNLFISDAEITVVLTDRIKEMPSLHLHLYKTEHVYDLNLRVPVKVARQKCAIARED